MHRKPKKYKSFLLLVVVLIISVSSSITHGVSIARAGDDSCSTSLNLYEIGCNIVRTSGDGKNYDYGTLLFTSRYGERKEGFCISAGEYAYTSNSVSGDEPLTYRGHYASVVGVPDKGFGTDMVKNAEYVVGYLSAAYYNGQLDQYVGDSEFSHWNIIANYNSSTRHVKIAAALAVLIHAWYDDNSKSAYLEKYMQYRPSGVNDLINRIIDKVPDLTVKRESSKVAFQDGNAYLVIQVPAGSSYRIEPAVEIKQRGSNFLVIPYTLGQNIRLCNDYSYQLLFRVWHVSGQNSSQTSAELNRQNQASGTLCTDYFAENSNFNLSISSSQMLQQRYVSGAIQDSIAFSYSGSWPCDAFENSLGTPGNCAKFAAFPATAKLYRRSELTTADSGTELTSVDINTPFTQKALSIVKPSSNTGNLDIIFNEPNPFPQSFYTAQINVKYGAKQSVHPQNINVMTEDVLRETTSTYNCTLQHTSNASNYSIIAGDGVFDTITLDGRCRSNATGSALGSGVFAANDTAEMMLIGPLSAPATRNSPSTRPSYTCAYNASDCIFYRSNIPLKNGTFSYGDFSNQLKPTTEGLYAFVLHYAGDVFTPEFWSDAGDGDEMFYVEGDHVQMWSKATPNAEISAPIQDTVYLSGSIRAGSYLVFEAYRAESKTATPQCASALPNFVSEPVLVGAHGGVYKSPTASSNEVGNVYWIATLYESDGSIYKDFYMNTQNGYYHEIRGICGEREETTEVKWNVDLSSDATGQATLTQSISDTAHIIADNIPTGFSYQFETYLDDGNYAGGKLVSSSQKYPLNATGDMTSPYFTPTNAGKYYWVVKLYDQFGNIYKQGIYGDPRETSYVADISSDVSTKYLQSGDEIYDVFHMQGSVNSNAVLVPTLWKVADVDYVVLQLDAIALQSNTSDYRTSNLSVHEVGEYYFTYELYVSSQLISSGMPHDPRESFTVIDITSTSPNSVYIGEEFHDIVWLHGVYPESSCIEWELYLIRNWERVNDDKLTSRTDCRKITDAKSSKAPNSNMQEIMSEDVVKLIPGTYYWVATVRNIENDNKTSDNANSGRIIAKGKKRDPFETTEVLSLTGTVSVYSETVERAFIGQRFFDKVNITGRIPEDGWIVWTLFKQDETSGRPADDTEVLTTNKKTIIDALIYSDDKMVQAVSDDVQVSEPGLYYWIEAVYSPLQNEPVAVGKPRVANESTRILPHTGIATTTSRAVQFSRVGQEFWDVVYVKCNLGDGTFANCLTTESGDKMLDDASIQWQIFRRNINSEQIVDDHLVFETTPMPLSAGTVNERGELEVTSQRISLDAPGNYYWVENLISPKQDEPVFTQLPRALEETTIVEETGNKYVKVGARRAELGQTGVAGLKIAGIATASASFGAWLKRRRRKNESK